MSQRRSHCRRQFQLSGYKAEQKSTLSNQIASLGGIYCENEHFLPESTHIVCRQPSRSEKFLGGLATGKWLLTTKYIQDSYQHGRWLAEEQYEWGPTWKECIPGNVDAVSYLSAPARWRKRIEESQQGPFTGWKVALFVDAVKKSVYKRLLRLGCAEVVDIQLPIKQCNVVAQQLTHVFVEDKFAKQVEGLAQFGVLCLKPLYIGAFLLLENTNPEEYNVLNSISAPQNHVAVQPTLSQNSSQSNEVKPNLSNTTRSRRRSSNVNGSVPTGSVAGASSAKQRSNGGNEQVTRRSVTMSESLTNTKTKTEPTEVTTPIEGTCIGGLFTPVGRSSTPVNEHPTPVKTCSTPVTNQSQGIKETKNGIISSTPRTPCKSKKQKPVVSHFKGSSPSPSNGNSRKGKKKFDSSNNRSMFEFITRTPRAGQGSTDGHTGGSLESTPLKVPPGDKESSDAVPLKMPPGMRASNDAISSSQSPQPIIIEPINDSEDRFSPSLQSVSEKRESIPDEFPKEPESTKPNTACSPVKACRKSRRIGSIKMTPEKYRKMLGKRTKQVTKMETMETSASLPSPAESSAATNDEDDVIITKFIPSPCKLKKSNTNAPLPSDSAKSNSVNSTNKFLPSAKTSNVDTVNGSSSPTKLQAVQNNPETATSSVDTKSTHTPSCVSQLPMDVDSPTKKPSQEPRGLKRKLDSAMVYSAVKKIKLDEIVTQGLFRHHMPSCPFSEKCERETNVRLPLAHVMSSLVEAPMEENKVAVGVDQLLLILSTKHYPSTRVLRTLLRKGFLDAQSTSDTDKVYDCLHQILLLHPPVTPVLQQMYLDSLQFQEGRDSGPGEAWDVLINSLSVLVNGEDSAQVIYSNLKLFKFLVAVMQRDFQHAFLSSISKLRRTIISQIVWPAGQVGIFNTRCQQLLNQFAEILQINENDLQTQWNITKMELITLVLSVLTMIGEVCYIAGKNSRPCLLEETPNNAVTLARELAYRLKELTSNSLLETVLSSIRSPWLVIVVIEVMLSTYDNSLVKPREDLNSAITLRKIVSQYMFMLPPSKDVNANTSRMPSTNSSICNTPKMLSPLKNRNPLTPSKQIVIATPLSSSQRKKIVDVNKKNMKGETALHRACIQNKLAKVKELLATPGININMPDNGGWTPLHEASNHGHVQCVRELLNYRPANTIMSYFKTVSETKGGVNLLAAAEDGTTPLHDAVMNDHVEVAMLILEKGGEKLLQAKLKNGAVPEDLAISAEMKDALNGFKLRQNRLATPGKLRTKLHFFSESQDLDDSEINFSQLSQSSLNSEPDFGPSEDLYQEVLGMEIQSTFSEKLCARLLLLVQSMCQAYLNFYKLNLVALNLKEGDSSQGQTQGHSTSQDASTGQTRRSVRNKETDPALSIVDSSSQNSENAQITRLLEDLQVCQKIKYHMQDFKSHLLKISGKSNLDFCKARLMALDAIFRV